MQSEDYVARISEATPLGLLIINYELLLSHIEAAKKDESDFSDEIQKSKDFLLVLIKSLDFEYDISKDLYQIYSYVNTLLIKSEFSGDKTHLDEALNLLSMLLSSWRELTSIEDAKPVMENTSKIYAGLTYKNGELAEFTPDEEIRGFTV